MTRTTHCALAAVLDVDELHGAIDAQVGALVEAVGIERFQRTIVGANDGNLASTPAGDGDAFAWLKPGYLLLDLRWEWDHESRSGFFPRCASERDRHACCVCACTVL